MTEVCFCASVTWLGGLVPGSVSLVCFCLPCSSLMSSWSVLLTQMSLGWEVLPVCAEACCGSHAPDRRSRLVTLVLRIRFHTTTLITQIRVSYVLTSHQLWLKYASGAFIRMAEAGHCAALSPRVTHFALIPPRAAVTAAFVCPRSKPRSPGTWVPAHPSHPRGCL